VIGKIEAINWAPSPVMIAARLMIRKSTAQEIRRVISPA
jgi:hypothetical protein